MAQRDGMMKTIPLSQGKIALVDDGDYEGLMKHKWSATNHGHTFYAIRHERVDGKQVSILMHRQILGCNRGQQVDHRDRDGLNNTRANIRPCSASQNHMNTMWGRGKSGYRGVIWDKRGGVWVVRVKLNGRQKNIGYFDDAASAARAFDVAAVEHYGEFAILNFPEDIRTSE